MSVRHHALLVIGEHTFDSVEDFTYLGPNIWSNLKQDTELSSRIGKFSSAMALLSKKVWDNSKLTIKTKTMVYQAGVLSTQLCCSECWTLYSRQERRLNTIHLRCLRKILDISWQDHTPNKEVLVRAGTTRMFSACKTTDYPKIFCLASSPLFLNRQGGPSSATKMSPSETSKRLASLYQALKQWQQTTEPGNLPSSQLSRCQSSGEKSKGRRKEHTDVKKRNLHLQ